LAQNASAPGALRVASSRCPDTISPPLPPSEDRRRAARDLVTRAQAAAVIDDNATALALYQRAESLDASNPTTAYALGRAYEAAHDARAVAEYCRFLGLVPASPDGDDVRRRVAALSDELLPRRTATAAGALSLRRPLPAPGSALAYGLLLPGSGQFYTRRPLAGLFFTSATAGALYYAFQRQTRSTQVTKTALDPFGNPYEYQELSVTNTTPHRTTGLLAALGISVTGAVEAYVHARHANDVSRRADRGTRVSIDPGMSVAGRDAVGVRVRLGVLGH